MLRGYSGTAFVGIDPGLSGAVAVLAIGGALIEVWDTPTVEVFKRSSGRGLSLRAEPDVAAMAALLDRLASSLDVRMVVLEKVQPMPKLPAKRTSSAQLGVTGSVIVPKLSAAQQLDAAGKDTGWGATPNFTLGLSYGLWWALVVHAKLPLERVSPIGWRSVMLHGLPKGKETGRLRALEMFPSARACFKRRADHGRADAALLAEYGRRLVR